MLSRKRRRRWREYKTVSGRGPVRAFLADQSTYDRSRIWAAMQHVAEEGLTEARHLRGDIWEVRAEGRDQAFRVLFAPEGQRQQVLLSLEAFSKKTQRTPPGKIRLAEQRLADWRSRGRRSAKRKE